MTDGAQEGDSLGPSMGARICTVALSESEAALVQSYADSAGIQFEAAVQELLGSGLARRVQVRTGRLPSTAVRIFHRRGYH